MFRMPSVCVFVGEGMGVVVYMHFAVQSVLFSF
jgi:hypothetical protein